MKKEDTRLIRTVFDSGLIGIGIVLIIRFLQLFHYIMDVAPDIVIYMLGGWFTIWGSFKMIDIIIHSAKRLSRTILEDK